MIRPVVLAIDDDPEVLRAITRDLTQRYGDRYQVLDAPSGPDGLSLVAALERRQEPVALFLADQRMPGLSGTGFFTRAGARNPEAKRVLLTAYADTDAAIEAIDSARVDHYLLKPWQPPEQKPYPVLDDLLEGGLAAFRPAFQGVRLIAARWSPSALQRPDGGRRVLPNGLLRPLGGDAKRRRRRHQPLTQAPPPAAAVGSRGGS